MTQSDSIKIRGQKVKCHIGVPDEERARLQELLIHTELYPFSTLHELNDDVSNTIDYYAVSVLIDQVASEKPRKLIETLAEDIAGAVLANFPVRIIKIEIEKFILKNTQSVGVSITREA